MKNGEMDQDRLHKRLVGIARYWHGKFGLSYDKLGDLINSAWVIWLERKDLDIVFGKLRVMIIKELFMRVPHGSSITGIERPRMVGLGSIKAQTEPDFIGRVQLREICDVAARLDKGHKHKRARTLRMMVGLEDRKALTAKNYKNNVYNLRELLRKEGIEL